ncbi:MAG: hypothetical protein RLY74_577 [Actinomycetota bacterium]|jgi:hypothetical protein
MANDLFSALRTYLMKIGNGEKSPQELAAALNVWARESGEAIKSRVEEEVKRNVSKMGFAKESDLKRIESELNELRNTLNVKKSNVKKKTAQKKAPTKKRSTAKGKAR